VSRLRLLKSRTWSPSIARHWSKLSARTRLAVHLELEIDLRLGSRAEQDVIERRARDPDLTVFPNDPGETSE
jgi:hypothetical protein